MQQIYPNEASYIAVLESKIKQLEKKAEFDSLTISNLIVVSEKDKSLIHHFRKERKEIDAKLDVIIEGIKGWEI